MNRKLYFLSYVIILISIAGTAVMMYFMPDTVPVHYNFQGEVDRFGSKFEHLLWPAVTGVMGLILIPVANHTRKKGSFKDEKVLLYTTLFTLIFMTGIGFYFMYKAITYDPYAVSSSEGIMKFTGIACGILLICFGLLMPKAPLNSSFGLRTRWSKSSEKVWKQSQFFGGITSVIGGSLMTLLGASLPEDKVSSAITIILAFLLCMDIAATYYFYKKDNEQ